MITRKEIAREITFWYKAAKEDFKEGCKIAAYIAIGRGEAYLKIAIDKMLITFEEWKLLNNAFNKIYYG